MSALVIVDYGMGNLRSVQKAFEKVGHAATITSDPNQAAQAERLVLPGVGAFRDGIARLRESGLDQVIIDHIRAGKPFLGICLGLQLLFTTSHEDGDHAGLDVFAGEVLKFPADMGLKVPHMGWNQLIIRSRAPALANVADGASVYFVHSYYVAPRDPTIVATQTEYRAPFTSAIWHENVFATQFHPEKSQLVGLEMLRGFADA
jgi:glutamine amidotransferase